MRRAPDALGELPQLAPREDVAQLRLPHEHDLDELLGVGLQVRDEPDLLDHLGREVLGLVDEEHHVAALPPGLEQEAMEGVHQLLERLAVARHVEVVEGRPEQLGRGEDRVEHHRGCGVLGQTCQEVAGQGGLARAHLARDQDEAAALATSELEVGERLGVPLREVEKFRVGGEVEGFLGEPVPLFVHGAAPTREFSTGQARSRRAASGRAILRRWARCGSRPEGARCRGPFTDPAPR